MKKHIQSLIILISISTFSFGDSWTQKADFGGTSRKFAVGFSIGNKGYIGTGNDGDSLRTDFWEWDQSTNVWTQKANFIGTAREHATCFSIGNKGYVGTGYSGINLQDFWEWNQSTNIWTQKSNFPAAGRYHVTSFSIGNYGYFGLGFTNPPGSFYKDFWEYNSTTDVWTQIADFGGSARYGAAGFSIASKGYVGSGYDGIDSITGVTNDFWEYDSNTNIWIQKSNFGGVVREHARGFSIGNKGYIGLGIRGAIYLQDFWEYDPAFDLWVQKSNFGGAARHSAPGFSIGNKGYMGTGYDNTFFRDFWEYTPDSTTSISSINDSKKGIIISPNPFSISTTVILDSKVNIENLELLINDMLGKTVLRQIIQSHQIEIRREALNTGQYSILILNRDQILINKSIIIE